MQEWIEEGYPHLIMRAHFVECKEFSNSNPHQSYRGGRHGFGGRPNGRWGSGTNSHHEGRAQESGGQRGSLVKCAQKLKDAGFKAWQCIRAHHCHDSFGLVLEHRAGWKLVRLIIVLSLPMLASFPV